jgi:hypothetical protein
MPETLSLNVNRGVVADHQGFGQLGGTQSASSLAVPWNNSSYIVFPQRSGLTEGNIAMVKIGCVPVRTRVPLSGWILAAVFTLLSIASSLTHMAPEHAVAGPSAQHASLSYGHELNRGAF